MTEAMLRDQVQAQVETICGTEGFRHSARHRQLLRFLVARWLANPREAVKEYELGVEVFGRPVHYDPRTDPIVRVEMRQLRLRLAAYYGGAGQSAPVRIDIPKGRYLAVISGADAPAASQASPAPVTPHSASAAPVTSPSASVAPRETASLETAVLLVTEPATGRPVAAAAWRVGLLTASVALLAAVTALVAIAVWRPAAPASASATVPTVAVVPFENLSVGEARRHLADGLTEEVLAALARVSGLRVIGTTSAFALKGANSAPDDVGRRLGADAVLTGSVRDAAGDVRVVVRLTDVVRGVVLWSRAYDRGDATAEPVEARVARGVADALRVRLDPASGQPFVRRGNDDPEAYDLYLRGRSLAHTRRTADMQSSVAYFERAIARDPDFALAHVALADAYGALAYNGAVRPADALARARAAAVRARQLDPALGEALGHLASLEAFVDWRWTEANATFAEALALTPSHARVRAWYGQSLLAQRRFDEAIAELEQAQRLDPLAASVTYALGEAFIYAARYPDAYRQSDRLLGLDAGSWMGRNIRARALVAEGRHDELPALLAPDRGQLWADVFVLVAEGQAPAARSLLNQRQHELAETQPFTLAALHALAGSPDAALDWLDRAYAIRQVELASLVLDPFLVRLAGEPRYEALASKVGLVSPR